MPIINGLRVNPAYVQTTTIPHVVSSPRARFGGATNAYYPQLSDIDAIDLSFYEDEDHSVIQYILEWQRLVYDGRGNYGAPYGPQGYKRDIVITFWGVTNRQGPIYTMTGCWPSTITNYDLTYNENSTLIVTATFSVDSTER